MYRERHHLRNGWETGDWPVVRGIFPVTTLEDQDRFPFEEPVVLLVPPVLDSPLHHLLHKLEHRFPDWRALLDGE